MTLYDLLIRVNSKEFSRESAFKKRIEGLTDEKSQLEERVAELSSEKKSLKSEVRSLNKGIKRGYSLLSAKDGELTRAGEIRKWLIGGIAAAFFVGIISGIGADYLLFRKKEHESGITQPTKTITDAIKVNNCLGNGDYDPRTEECYKKAITEEPNNPEHHYWLGLVYRSQERYPKAEAEFKKAIELDNKNVSYHLSLGHIYYMGEKFNQALTEYKKSIELDPREEYAYVGLGRTYHNQKKYPEAIAAYKKAIELQQLDPSLHDELGRMYQSMGNEAEAKKQSKIAEEMRKK